MSCTRRSRVSVKSGRASVASKAWKKVVNLPDLQQAQYKRVVVPVESAGNSFKILVQELNGEVYAIKNKCTHLNLPLQGKVVGKPLAGECVECPFHGTRYNVKTGAVEGDWAPGFPNLPFVGKVRTMEPVETFEARLDGDSVEVEIFEARLDGVSGEGDGDSCAARALSTAADDLEVAMLNNNPEHQQDQLRT